MNLPASSSLLRRTARRLQWAGIGRRYFLALLAAAGVYTLLLLVSRLLGVIPDWYRPLSLAAVPLAAALVALLLRPQITAADAGRVVDERCRTNDLYLTAALLESAPGEFKPLVERAAEAHAGTIRPDAVVPFRFGKRVGVAAAAIGVLAAASQWLPQLDPFGEVAAAQEQGAQRKKLAQSRRATRERVAQVRKEEAAARESQNIDKALADLKLSFNKMKPDAPRTNFEKLEAHRRDIADKWQKRDSQLKDFLSKRPTSQQFGAADQEQLRKWRKELEQGSTSGVEKAIEQMKKDIERLSKAKDPKEKQELTRQLRKQLQSLEDLAREQTASQPLSAALERALEQLEMARQEGLSSEALQGLKESLELSQLELEQLAQSVKDLQKLEEALSAIQAAMKVNGYKLLDGEACRGCQSLDEYAQKFAEMVETVVGGPGMGGPGVGQGNKAPEDDSIATDFAPDKAPTNVTAGKVLLTLKTRGLGEKGEVQQQYREALEQVKQGWSEAVLKERIPPGYTDSIRKYFDSIEEPAEDAPPQE
ncbi:MAG: hypothetical protein KY476_20440 [Planctomycetes bacterium]|nr:hypothetical protein [Planctomycetota bacterium]